MVIILCEVCSSYTTPQGICSNNSTLMRRMNKACYFQSWDSISGTVTRLWAGYQETTIQHLARTRDFSLFQNVQTSSEVHPASYLSGTRSSLQSHSMRLTTHHHLVLRLRMHEAVPLHPRYAFMTHRETTLSFCHSFSTTLCYVNFNHHCPASYKTESKLTTRLNTM